MTLSMAVEVVFAEPGRQVVVELELAAGATVAQALDLAMQDARLQTVDLAGHEVGIYGQRCERQRLLQPGDRVEIYRELVMDAKTARRKRAQQQRH